MMYDTYYETLFSDGDKHMQPNGQFHFQIPSKIRKDCMCILLLNLSKGWPVFIRILGWAD